LAASTFSFGALNRARLSENNFLALLWRERIKVRVMQAEFALTLALSQDGRGKSYA
jgi:hypothetical protein